MLVDNFPTLQSKSNIEYFLNELAKDLARFSTEVSTVKDLLKTVKTIDDLKNQITGLQDEVIQKKAEVQALSASIQDLKNKHVEAEQAHVHKLETIGVNFVVEHENLKYKINEAETRKSKALQDADEASAKHKAMLEEIQNLRRKYIDG